MNQLCALTCTVVRSYSRRMRSKPDTAGLRRKIALTKDTDESDVSIDMGDEDFADVSQLETDFTNVQESYVAHTWQMKRAREKLQEDITADRYFKVVDPPFLTFSEQDKIKRLHREDPEEWTVERLSEKFPALPNAIDKILKDKWKPTTVERVLKHDKRVVENWKKFQAGKLAVSNSLKSHLLKFGDRASKINLKHSEKIAEFLIAPKIEIPKPKHNIFVRLVSSAETEPEQMLLPAKGQTSQEKTNAENSKIQRSDRKAALKESAKLLTFTQFAEKTYEKIHEKSDQEAAVLLDAYANQSKLISEVNAKDRVLEGLDKTKEIVPTENQVVQKNSLQTYVVKKETIEDTPVTYIYPIKIPSGAYKKGKTYRIHDCYYDDDGEFLYRIPGLKS